MVWWIVLGIIIGLVALILFIPIGAEVSYIGEQLKVSAKVGGVKIKLLPKEPEDEKAKKAKRPKKEKAKKEKPPKEQAAPNAPKHPKLSLTREEMLELAKRALKGLGKFGKPRVDDFLLHVVVAGKDPYNTVSGFNFLNSAICVLAPLCSQSFKVKEYDISTDIDFTTERPRADVSICIVIRLSQVFHAAFSVAFGAMGILIRSKKRQKMEQRLVAQQIAAQPQQNIENTQDNTLNEERTDSNG